MTRRLTLAEREVWDRLRKTVRPLGRRVAKGATDALEPAEPPAKPEKAQSEKAKPDQPKHRRSGGPPAAQPRPAQPPALAPLEEKTRRRLGRGAIAIDSRIDLHGMRQERAHAVLLAFLRAAQARGDRIALVVTGKGTAGAEGRGGEPARGILRHVVPDWLARPDLRALVVGFEPAHRHHGGEGALYVRLRRRRAARLPGPPG